MNRSKVGRAALFFGAALVFVLAFSKSTSPLYTNAVGIDSSIFMVIGKYWTRGVLPYVGLWDQKGPVIFALNALGWALFENWCGLLVLQVLSLFLTLIVVFRTLRTSFSEAGATLLTLFALVLLRLTYVGNSTEEFLLPLLSLCFYRILVFARGYRLHTFEHPRRDAFLYGFTFSFCLLTRLTNALGLCGAVLVIAVALAADKKWKNLLENALFFLAGAAMLALPFGLYFYRRNAFQDLLYGTILYNLDYLAAASLGKLDLYTCAKLCLRFGICALLPLIGLAELLDSKTAPIRGWIWICSGLFLLLWFLKSTGYEHYGMLAFPCFALSMAEGKASWEASDRKAAWKALRILLCAFLFAVALGSGIFTRGELLRYRSSTEAQRQNTISGLLSVVPAEERDEIVAYNLNPCVYILQDLRPCCRFFALQDKQASKSASMKSLLLDAYAEGSAKWILFEGRPDRSCIAEILKRDYTLVQVASCREAGERFLLYVRNDAR